MRAALWRATAGSILRDWDFRGLMLLPIFLFGGRAVALR